MEAVATKGKHTLGRTVSLLCLYAGLLQILVCEVEGERIRKSVNFCPYLFEMRVVSFINSLIF